MKHLLIQRTTLLLATAAMLAWAPFTAARAQEPVFPERADLYNADYDVFIKIDRSQQKLTVPGHDLYGPLDGYIGKTTSTFYWLVLDVEERQGALQLQLVNDFGSEDLAATLSQVTDSTFRLTQGKGSTIKVPFKGKWLKLPKTLDFKRR